MGMYFEYVLMSYLVGAGSLLALVIGVWLNYHSAKAELSSAEKATGQSRIDISDTDRLK